MHPTYVKENDSSSGMQLILTKTLQFASPKKKYTLKYSAAVALMYLPKYCAKKSVIFKLLFS